MASKIVFVQSGGMMGRGREVETPHSKLQPPRLTSLSFRARGCLRNSATLGSLSCSASIRARSIGGMGDADATIGSSAQGAGDSTSGTTLSGPLIYLMSVVATWLSYL